MVRVADKPKFPKFMGYLYSQGLNMKMFTGMLNNKGYDQYNYNNVRRKLNGESDLNYDDIIIFSHVLGVEESIFFDS